jgi:hypothetical protein
MLNLTSLTTLLELPAKVLPVTPEGYERVHVRIGTSENYEPVMVKTPQGSWEYLEVKK